MVQTQIELYYWSFPIYYTKDTFSFFLNKQFTHSGILFIMFYLFMINRADEMMQMLYYSQFILRNAIFHTIQNNKN